MVVRELAQRRLVDVDDFLEIPVLPPNTVSMQERQVFLRRFELRWLLREALAEGRQARFFALPGQAE